MLYYASRAPGDLLPPGKVHPRAPAGSRVHLGHQLQRPAQLHPPPGDGRAFTITVVY